MNGLGEMVEKSPQAGARSIFSATRATTVVITGDEAGQRLDNYLVRHAKGVPKSHVYRVIRGGEVRVNGRRVDVDRRVAEGDVVRLPPLRVAAPAAPVVRRERAVPLGIVHEDDDLLVVDKPAGVAVHGGSGLAFGVIEQLRAARPEARVLELVHRLDRETSGLLVVAKKRGALVALHAAWREDRVKKRYRALSIGAWPERQRQVKAALVKTQDAAGERRVRVADRDTDAMPALTVFHPLERLDGPDGAFGLLDVDLRTGRTHQIRVHLAHLGRPIAGDDKYGDFDANRRLAKARGSRPALKRMFLHAASLSLAHPRTGEAMQFEAALPQECERFLDGLRGDG